MDLEKIFFKRAALLLVLLLCLDRGMAQDDPAPPVRKGWRVNSFGLSWLDGNVQFFEGYNYEILNTDARSGLPIYPDWNVYQGVSLLPTYFQFGANTGIVDSTRMLKLRLAFQYARRQDSMATTSGYALNDTIFGRNASESGGFFSLAVAGMKQSRKLLGFLRFYGGAELELSLSPRSKIFFLEFSYDTGEKVFTDINTYHTRGKPRFNIFGTAVLGLEAVFLKHFGLTLEVKSGLGAQIVVREPSYGMARNSYHLGLNYFLWDYGHRKARKRTPEETSPESTDL